MSLWRPLLQQAKSGQQIEGYSSKPIDSASGFQMSVVPMVFIDSTSEIIGRDTWECSANSLIFQSSVSMQAISTCPCLAARSSARVPGCQDPYTCTERTLTLYGSELARSSGQSFFGSVEPGIQVHTICPLFLVRETRHDDKAKDRHSALARYSRMPPAAIVLEGPRSS